jgi:hypothetical protein
MNFDYVELFRKIQHFFNLNFIFFSNLVFYGVSESLFLFLNKTIYIFDAFFKHMPGRIEKYPLYSRITSIVCFIFHKETIYVPLFLFLVAYVDVRHNRRYYIKRLVD